MTNNYDKHAIEPALQIVEKKGDDGKVTAVCLGSGMADKVVKEAIVMGCHEAIRIENSDACNKFLSCCENSRCCYQKN